MAGAGVTLVAAVRTSAEVEVTSVADTLAAAEGTSVVEGVTSEEAEGTSVAAIPGEAAIVEVVTEGSAGV